MQELDEKIKAFLPNKRMSNDGFSSPAKYIGLNENEAPLQDFIPCVASTPVKHSVKAVPSSSPKHLSNNEDSRTICNAVVQVFTLFIILILLNCTHTGTDTCGNDIVNIVLSAGQLSQSQRLKHNLLSDHGLMASQTKQRKLQPVLEPLGRALLRGTWKEIASAAYRVKKLRSELAKCMWKQLSVECSDIVSSKQESLLRKSKVNDIRNLSLTNICQELKGRIPLLYSIMIVGLLIILTLFENKPRLIYPKIMLI